LRITLTPTEFGVEQRELLPTAHAGWAANTDRGSTLMSTIKAVGSPEPMRGLYCSARVATNRRAHR
jgi:hypothetical protein